jgi:hypothetical protein
MRDMSEGPNDLRLAHDAARRLVKMLDEPEVGLFSWHMRLGQIITDLRDRLNTLMPPDISEPKPTTDPLPTPSTKGSVPA